MSEGSIRQQVEHFYARQMKYLDRGQTAEWARTFTPDGVFAADGHPEPQQGRAVIEAKAAAMKEQLAEQGIQRRHWLGMVDVTENTDSELSAHCYALVIGTPRGGQPVIQFSCTCEDVLVRDGDSFLVKHRQVRRDDLGMAGAVNGSHALHATPAASLPVSPGQTSKP